MTDVIQLFIIGMIVVLGSNILSAFLGIEWLFHANIIGIFAYFGLLMFWIFYSGRKESRYNEYKQLDDLRTVHTKNIHKKEYGFEINNTEHIPTPYISGPPAVIHPTDRFIQDMIRDGEHI